MVAESSEFHLKLSRAHRVHFFQQEIPRKKRDILSEKRESGMVLKKLEFTPESGSVDTYSTGILRQKATVRGTNCNRSFFNGVWSSKVSFITY